MAYEKVTNANNNNKSTGASRIRNVCEGGAWGQMQMAILSKVIREGVLELVT